MSGRVLRYNPQSRTFVQQGADGKFAPKVLSSSPSPKPAAPVVQSEGNGELKIMTQTTKQ